MGGIRQKSIVYNSQTVCGMLGFPNNCSEEVPEAADGKVVVWYGGWTLEALEASGKIVNCLSRARAKKWMAPAGYYDVHIPMPDRKWMTYDELIAHLNRRYAAFKELPTPVGATVLAVHLGVTGEDPLKGDYCVCADVLPSGRHVLLYVIKGRVIVSCPWVNCHYNDVLLRHACSRPEP